MDIPGHRELSNLTREDLEEIVKKNEKKETRLLIGIPLFLIGIVLSIMLDDSYSSPIMALMSIICIISGFSIMVALNISMKTTASIKEALDKDTKRQKEKQLRKHYLLEKAKFDIPTDAAAVKYTKGYADIIRRHHHVWVEEDSLYFFPTDQFPESEMDQLKLFQIPLDKIEYYATRGEIVYENKISGGGGGGSSLKGAVVGGVIAGGAGAIIGSRKKTDPIKSELIKHDSRECFINYFDEDNKKHSIFFEYQDVHVFNDLIPNKSFEFINTRKLTNNSNINFKTNSTELVINQIKELAKLKDDGIVTEEEFQEKKKQLLSKIS